MSVSGGCQCGAVRFSAGRVGRAGICHCRMCQKATGGFFAPFVDVYELTWTRGEPTYFQSSNLAQRGFCAACGTPLTYEAEGSPLNVAVGAFDHPEALAPVIQVGTGSKLPFADGLSELPHRTPAEEAKVAGFYAEVVSNQHPDHDTEAWPPK